MGAIKSKVRGVTFTNADGSRRQAIIRKHCRPGVRLYPARERDNPEDRHAVGLWVRARAWFFFERSYQVGHVGSNLSEDVARHMDRGGAVEVYVLDVTGGGWGKSYGVNIEIRLL